MHLILLCLFPLLYPKKFPGRLLNLYSKSTSYIVSFTAESAPILTYEDETYDKRTSLIPGATKCRHLIRCNDRIYVYSTYTKHSVILNRVAFHLNPKRYYKKLYAP